MNLENWLTESIFVLLTENEKSPPGRENVYFLAILGSFAKYYVQKDIPQKSTQEVCKKSGKGNEPFIMMIILGTERGPESSNFGHLHQNYHLTG